MSSSNKIPNVVLYTAPYGLQGPQGIQGPVGPTGPVTSVNGQTGAITNLAVTNNSQSFSGLQNFTTGISTPGITLTGSGVTSYISSTGVLGTSVFDIISDSSSTIASPNLIFGDTTIFEVISPSNVIRSRDYRGGTYNINFNINRSSNTTSALFVNHSTGKNVRLGYNIPVGLTNYVDLDVSSTGNLLITPSGGTAQINGRIQANNIVYTVNGQTGTITGALLNYSASVKEYGAIGNGVANDTTSIQNALNSGYKNIYFPSGTYKVNSTLTIPKDVSIFGDGPSLSIIDGNAGSCWGTQVPVLKNSVTGITWSLLPNLVSGISEGNRSLNFATAHGLCVGDMVWVTGNTAWNLYLFDYPPNKGEIRRIGSIQGTTGAIIQGTFYDNYSLSGLSLYKVSNYSNGNIKNLGIVGQGISGSYDIGVELRYLKDTSIENVKVTNCSAEALNLGQCDNVYVNNCYAEDVGGSQYGLDYGLILYNCQNIFVNGGYYTAARHATTMGTVPTYLSGSGRYYPSFGIVNRNVTFNGISAFKTTAPTDIVGAVDTHLGSEYIKFVNCFVDGGFNIAGDKITIDGCQIIGENTGLIYVGYLKGTNLNIQNNYMRTNNIPNINTTGVFVNIGGQFESLGFTTAQGGVINISNNVMEYANENQTRTAGDSDRRMWLSLINRGYTGEDIDVNIEGNVIQAGKNYPQGAAHIGAGSAAAGLCQALFNTINFSNNNCSNVGGLVIHAGSNVIANSVIFQGNKIFNSYDGTALYCRPVKKSVICKNNTIDGTRTSGTNQPVGGIESAINIAGQGSTLLGWNGYIENVHVSDNTVFNGLQTANFSTSTRADIFIAHTRRAVTHGNIVGSDTKSLNVSNNSNFLLNENITGSSSGAISSITGFRGTTQIGISNVGFTANEIITGSLSGKTATINGILSNHATNVIFLFNNTGAGTTSWFGRNVSISSEGLTFAPGSGSGMAVVTI
jgi:hypothetical protein